MNLIIDIPDEEYNRIKEWEDNITGYQTSLVLYRAVRNGTPYEERQQGDLISREALRKELQGHAHNGNYATFYVNSIIDNAPTVDKGYQEGHIDGVLQGEKLYARPLGKWIYTDKEDKEKGFGGYCSLCKCDMPIGINDWKQEYYESKFCPNCGADMKVNKND